LWLQLPPRSPARFSEAFSCWGIEYRHVDHVDAARSVAVMNITYARLIQRCTGRPNTAHVQLLMLGCAILVVANLVLASAQTTTVSWSAPDSGDCTWVSPKELSVQWLLTQHLEPAARRSVPNLLRGCY
jgi:hypothetical protein